NYTAVATVNGQRSNLDGTLLSGCKIGQEGMRNQNIYSSRITEGLAVFSPQNTKPLSSTFQRVFVIVVQNLTSFSKAFRLTISRQPAAGAASFLQTAARTTLEVNIGARAGIARPLFATSSNPGESITVNVVEITSATPSAGVVPGGLSGFVVLNADPSSLSGGSTLIDPECQFPTTPHRCSSTGIGSPGVHDPDLANPDLSNP